MRRTITMLLLLVATSAIQAATLTETVDRSFDVRPGATLSVDNVNGRIRVSAWDQPKIRVVAEKKVERTDDADAKRALAELRVELRQSGDGVQVKTTTPNSRAGFWDFLFGNWNEASVTYEISVPRSAQLRIENTNGRVMVTGVHGSLKVETTNGQIELADCGGAIEVSTTNGRIIAALTSLDASGSNSIETTNGRIELTLPPTVRATLDASTTNGRVESELPITSRSIGRSEIRGTVNGGGVSFRLRTTNGGIQIHAGGGVAQAAR